MFWYNGYTHEKRTSWQFFTCKEWTSHTCYAKSGCKLILSSQGKFRGLKDNKSKTEAKTNSWPRRHPLFVRSLLFACKEHTWSPLFACRMRARKHTHTHTHTHKTSPPRADPNFFTHFTAKGGLYLNGQHLACEVLTKMYVILTRSGLLFICKMI